MPTVAFNIPAKDVQKTQSFLEAVLDLKIPENPMDPAHLSKALKINEPSFLIVSSRNSADETPICYFQVEDLNAAAQAVASRGGRVLAGPFTIQVAYKGNAQAMVLADPDGNGVGIFTI
jgi:predicted enzyme related to lactoylglutathione lyase